MQTALSVFLPPAGSATHVDVADIQAATPRLRNLKRRLDRWELEHLREHAAELAERLEAAEQRAAEAERRLNDAEYACDFWHDQAVDAHNAAADAAGGMPGITMDGWLVVVPPPSEGLHA
jgi:hypothetical protein